LDEQSLNPEQVFPADGHDSVENDDDNDEDEDNNENDEDNTFEPSLDNSSKNRDYHRDYPSLGPASFAAASDSRKHRKSNISIKRKISRDFFEKKKFREIFIASRSTSKTSLKNTHTKNDEQNGGVESGGNSGRHAGNDGSNNDGSNDDGSNINDGNNALRWSNSVTKRQMEMRREMRTLKMRIENRSRSEESEAGNDNHNDSVGDINKSSPPKLQASGSAMMSRSSVMNGVSV
jgi:hypothetical protein